MAALVLGLLVALGGVVMWSYPVCDLEVFGTCVQYSRPLTELGMVAMIFGGILFVVGIVLLAIPGQPSSQPRPPERETLEVQMNEDIGAWGSPKTFEAKYCAKCGTLNPFEAKNCNSCAKEFPG